ncbi:MAG: hypothetical protein QN187_17905 [Armatimonadota bacterium]|nr:hypothetical protein [Armatimonadota bacterium]
MAGSDHDFPPCVEVRADLRAAWDDCGAAPGTELLRREEWEGGDA